jgi:hypothetical protein
VAFLNSFNSHALEAPLFISERKRVLLIVSVDKSPGLFAVKLRPGTHVYFSLTLTGVEDKRLGKHP